MLFYHVVGSIPASLGSLSLLDTLQVNDNKLIGGPARAMSIGDVAVFNSYLSVCLSIVGTIPYEIGFPDAGYVVFNRNSFTGSIPNSFCGNTALSHIQLDIMLAPLECYPVCLTDSGVTVTAGSTSSGCPSDQENGVCALVAATNIQTIDPEWACDVSGYPVTNPCASGQEWSGMSLGLQVGL